MKDMSDHCCAMRKKVLLGVVEIKTVDECGVPDSELADFHDFSYESKTNLPIVAALVTKFCPWCGKPRSQQTGQTVETFVRDRAAKNDNDEG